MGQSLKMLLVDDDQALTGLLESVIRRGLHRKVHLTTLCDSSAATRWIDEHRPGLVLTDLEMPGISGWEILRLAKQRNPLSQVVIFSGNFSRDALVRASKLGADDYVLKSIDLTEVLCVLKQACERIARWEESLLRTVSWRMVSKARIA